MQRYEYRVIAAPTRGLKAKGIKTAEARFSHALEDAMNTMAADGWEYQRAETLPSTERAGLTSTTTKWRNVLVFRRAQVTDDVQEAAVTVAVAPQPETEEHPQQPTTPETSQDDASHSAGSGGILTDTAVEEPGEAPDLTTTELNQEDIRKDYKSND